jgi:hypothetical protein
VRFRESNPEDLDRARQLVAKWRDENPQGSAEEMLRTLGGQFREGYEPVLRGVLAAIELHGAKIVTGITITGGPRE